MKLDLSAGVDVEIKSLEGHHGKFDVYNLDKKKVGEIELADAVFGAEVNEHLFYEVVKAQLASERRAPTR